MDMDLEEFSTVANEVDIVRERKKFKISQLKLEHFYLEENDKSIGTPISTGIELLRIYNHDEEKLEWQKVISHTYASLENTLESSTDTYFEKDSNLDKTIKDIEKIDLRELKSNYYTEDSPENLTHWEITYNNIFKIVGTYDQVIDEYKEISEILDFKNIIKNEPLKIINRIEGEEGGNTWN